MIEEKGGVTDEKQYYGRKKGGIMEKTKQDSRGAMKEVVQNDVKGKGV